MKDEPRPVHQLEHAEPTVIHHPEEDMTILARWLRRGMEQGPRFWMLLGGTVLAVLVVATIVSGLAAARSAGSEAWMEVIQAKTADDRIKISEAHPNTPVAHWAKLLSAQEEYANGIDDLITPGKKETSGARLMKAIDLFQQVAKEAPKDSSQALAAMFGAARAMEAHNDLGAAIEQYRLVATKFPNTPEAKRSLELARALEEPVNATFYKELYAYKPPATPTTSGSMSAPNSLFGPGSKSPLDAIIPKDLLNMPVPKDLDAPPPSTAPVPVPTEAPKTEAPKTEAPKPEAPKTETPAAPAQAPTPPKS